MLFWFWLLSSYIMLSLAIVLYVTWAILIFSDIYLPFPSTHPAILRISGSHVRSCRCLWVSKQWSFQNRDRLKCWTIYKNNSMKTVFYWFSWNKILTLIPDKKFPFSLTTPTASSSFVRLRLAADLIIFSQLVVPIARFNWMLRLIIFLSSPSIL